MSFSPQDAARQRLDYTLREALALLSLVTMQIDAEPDKTTALDLRDRTRRFLTHIRSLPIEATHANPS